MACFLVPATEAVITTTAQLILKKKEDKEAGTSAAAEHIAQSQSKARFSVKLGWLNKLLWGGSALLAFEHLWHGEVVPYFPFLTAMTNGETSEMLAEMSSVGVTMAVLVTAIWGAMVAISGIIEKRQTDGSTVKEGV